jgi:hypothetical protein
VRGVPATLDRFAPHPAVPGPQRLLQPRRSAFDHMRKAEASIFIGDLVASVRVFGKLAAKPKATALLLHLHRARWGRTPHKVTTGTGVPMLFHTGRGGALFHCRFGRGLYVKAFPGAMLSNPICFNGKSSGTLRS